MSQDGWTEESSTTYRQLASVAVPARAEQIAALLTLIPCAPDAPFRAVELASGEGLLSAALLDAFPQATMFALDGEESMRAATNNRLSWFGERATVDDFDLAKDNWYDHLNGADVVLSSLCIHHLNSDEKQQLFQAVAERLSDNGALLIADLVRPARPEGWELFAATWDESAQAQSVQKTGSKTLYEFFQNERWNYYRHPDPFDKPSSLFDQLNWLKAAGFAVVDCFWMQAGHAIYGGYKRAGNGSRGLTYADALRAAQSVLGEKR